MGYSQPVNDNLDLLRVLRFTSSTAHKGEIDRRAAGRRCNRKSPSQQLSSGLGLWEDLHGPPVTDMSRCVSPHGPGCAIPR